MIPRGAATGIKRIWFAALARTIRARRRRAVLRSSERSAPPVDITTIAVNARSVATPEAFHAGSRGRAARRGHCPRCETPRQQDRTGDDDRAVEQRTGERLTQMHRSEPLGISVNGHRGPKDQSLATASRNGDAPTEWNRVGKESARQQARDRRQCCRSSKSSTQRRFRAESASSHSPAIRSVDAARRASTRIAYHTTTNEN